MKKFNLDDVQESVKNIIPGAYICRITGVIDHPDREYLEINFDIAEGEYKNYYSDLFKQFGGNWRGRIYRSYKEKAMVFFKAFIVAVEKSNPGYTWNWDENSLINRLVVVVFGEEEYLWEDELRINVKPQDTRSIEALREGKIKLPTLKKLPPAPAPVIIEPDKDLPF